MYQTPQKGILKSLENMNSCKWLLQRFNQTISRVFVSSFLSFNSHSRFFSSTLIATRTKRNKLNQSIYLGEEWSKLSCQYFMFVTAKYHPFSLKASTAASLLLIFSSCYRCRSYSSSLWRHSSLSESTVVLVFLLRLALRGFRAGSSSYV